MSPEANEEVDGAISEQCQGQGYGQFFFYPYAPLSNSSTTFIKPSIATLASANHSTPSRA